MEVDTSVCLDDFQENAVPPQRKTYPVCDLQSCGSDSDRSKGVPPFDEMVAIILEEVDFDDPTTNVRGRRALAIAKPTPRGY